MVESEERKFSHFITFRVCTKMFVRQEDVFTRQRKDFCVIECFVFKKSDLILVYNDEA